MTAGKLAAQAGHAFLDTFELCRAEFAPRAEEYRNGQHGTKVVLGAKNLAALHSIYDEARAAGLPCTLITDEGHVLLPHFDGSPIITAVGIGPVLRHEHQHITKRLAMVR